MDGHFRKILTRVAECSSISFPIHPHMLRHACGYKLVNDGHDVRMIQQYLGYKNIQHTVRYTVQYFRLIALANFGQTRFP